MGYEEDAEILASNAECSPGQASLFIEEALQAAHKAGREEMREEAARVVENRFQTLQKTGESFVDAMFRAGNFAAAHVRALPSTREPSEEKS